MAEPPEIEITSGSPTPEEERAVREAILELWREDQRKAARARRLGAWASIARVEGTGATGVGMRSWRWATGFTQPGVVAARRVGRDHQG